MLRWVMTNYGHVLPAHTVLDGMQFSQAIAETYYTGPESDGPINNTAAEVAARIHGMFYRTWTELRYTPPGGEQS